jgi:hypothetical protein
LDWDDNFIQKGKLWVKWNERGMRFVLTGKSGSYDGALEPGPAVEFYDLVSWEETEPGPVTGQAEAFVGVGDGSRGLWWWEKTNPLEITGNVSRRYIYWDETDLYPVCVKFKGATPAPAAP